MTATEELAATFLADIFREDLERLMPGCDVAVAGQPSTRLIAVAAHRTTGRRLVVELAGDEWTVTYGTARTYARTSGTSAYGFDSAVVHAYRHDLDFTPEHGPGSAHDYAGRA